MKAWAENFSIPMLRAFDFFYSAKIFYFNTNFVFLAVSWTIECNAN